MAAILVGTADHHLYSDNVSNRAAQGRGLGGEGEVVRGTGRQWRDLVFRVLRWCGLLTDGHLYFSCR